MDSPSDRPEDGVDAITTQYHELAELAGSLAHEIKNPLSVIRMNMDLLAEDFSDAETPRERRAQDKIKTVHQQCERLETLLNDFLKFSRLHRLDLLPGSLNEHVQRVIDLFAYQARADGIEILPHLDSDLPRIQLDAKTLEAALLNLVKNSLEAMTDGGELTVITRITRKGVALDLIDTGHGMDQRTAMHMFEAFYTTKQNGSGLGLPTAKKIIEAHGGRISVHSEIGRGTKFTLEFPTPARIAD